MEGGAYFHFAQGATVNWSGPAAATRERCTGSAVSFFSEDLSRFITVHCDRRALF